MTPQCLRPEFIEYLREFPADGCAYSIPGVRVSFGELADILEHEAKTRAENERTSSELRTAQAGWRADQESLIHVTEQWHGSEKKLDAACAEVARVTELAIFERDSAAREIERLTAALEEMFAWINEAEDIAMPSDKDVYGSLRDMARAALRGDTAPAVYTCQNYPDGDGDGAVLSLRNHACPTHGDPAPAQPDATMLTDNSMQTSSQAPATGRK